MDLLPVMWYTNHSVILYERRAADAISFTLLKWQKNGMYLNVV